MQYKALMLDFDGTTIPNRIDGMPSQRVCDAIKNASKKLHVGIATSRPFKWIRNSVKLLQLSGPSIVSTGAQIINTKTREIYKEYLIDPMLLEKIITILKKHSIEYIIDDNGIRTNLEITPHPQKPLSVFVNALDEKTLHILTEELSTLPEIAINKTVSWTAGKYDLIISHPKATKQNGIFEVAKLLSIDTHEIIGVGDGYNDFPLLMACGLKVAMGNAVDDLKSIADYIAPTVEEDGVADVIEKFVLQ